MNERQKHSLKSDLIVGISGLALAAGVTYTGTESHEDYINPKSRNRNANPICYADELDGRIVLGENCSAFIIDCDLVRDGKEIYETVSGILQPFSQEIVEIENEICQGVGN